MMSGSDQAKRIERMLNILCKPCNKGVPDSQCKLYKIRRLLSHRADTDAEATLLKYSPFFLAVCQNEHDRCFLAHS